MRRFIAVCTLAAAAWAAPAFGAPLKCPSNDVNVGLATVKDGITLVDPVQNGHLYASDPGVPPTASTCAAPKAAPAVVDPTQTFHYKAHTFKNRSNAAACVDVRYIFYTGTEGAGFHEATTYLGSFDPADVAKNYLGDSGFNSGGPDVRVYSITVPAMADFVVVATWAGPSTPGYEPNYDLWVANCGQMAISAVTPNAGPVEGGQNVSISGSGFEGTAPAVTIGTAAATNVIVVDDSTLAVTTAANVAGTYDVTATSGAVSATLPQSYTYGGVAIDAGAGDGGLDAGKDASTGGPTQGGPTQGSSSSSSGGTSTNDASTGGGADDDDDDASTGDGGTKKVSGATKKKTSGDEEYVCACNEVGRSTTPGLGAFATMALGLLAVLRLKKRR